MAQQQLVTQQPLSIINDIVNVKQETDIKAVVRKGGDLISQIEKQHYSSINVTDAMNKLAICGSLIELAYASSNGFKCQAEVALLLSKYGTLVKDSSIASAKFVNTSLSSLSYHKIALKILNKKPEKSVRFIAKCSKLAETMAIVSNELVDKAGQLTNIAENAFTKAVNDKSVSYEKRKELEKKITDAKAKEAELSKSTQQLAQQVTELAIAEEKAAVEAAAESQRKFVISIIKTCLAPINETIGILRHDALLRSATGVAQVAANNINDHKCDQNDDDDETKAQSAVDDAKTVAEKALLLTKQKYEVQNKLIEQNAELAKTVAELSGFKGNGNKLERALKSIEIAIKTLGKIKVIFSNTKVFWEGVKANCDKIAQIGDTVNEFADVAADCADEIKEAIMESALNWFVLCKVNYFAKEAINQVDKGMDSILNNLPDESEALKLVDEQSAEMQIALQQENKQIKASIAN